MIKSMTGYGRSQEIINGRDITVEIKSVNHRFFEFSSRVPRMYGFLEDQLKSYIQKNVSRGKIDVSVNIITVSDGETSVDINYDLAEAYIKSLRKLGEKENLPDDISLSSISRFSDIFTVKKTVLDEEQLWLDVKSVTEKSLERFINMREIEGSRMKEDILSKLEIIEKNVAQIEATSPETVNQYREKLYSKLKEILSDKDIDDHRILTEAAVFAEKIAVDEETVRLKSHIRQCRDFLTYDEPVGRKLDFLIQEFNRETNTIGSKSQNLDIAKIVVDMKSEIEKIREQVQNIE